jgi:hypothetical protein
MGSCTDPRMTYLNDSGYNVLRLPRRGILPLGVIGRDGSAKSWLGTLDQIWTSKIPVPAVGAPQSVVGLNGEKTSNIEAAVGLDILANALGGMLGGGAPSVNTSYQHARYVQFAFKDVRSVGIDPFLIGNFLAEGVLKPSPVVARYFSGKFGIEALVVSEILEAKSISVTGKRDAKTAVDVNLPQIQAALGAKVKVTAGNAEKTELVYEGDQYLTFGFKVFGIGRKDGKWNIYGKAAGAGNAYLADAEQIESIVMDRDELLDLDTAAR